MSNTKLIFFALFLSLLPNFLILFLHQSFFNHDTLDILINYKFSYDSLASSNEFPLWNPYYAYGITTSLSNLAVSSSQYLSLLIGKIIHSSSFFLFFNFSIVFDSFLYMTGIILLLKHLKIANYIILYSITIAALTLNPIASFGFDYYFLIKLPLLIYAVIWTLEKFKERIIFFLLFFISYIFAGMPLYFFILYIYITAVLFVINFIYIDKKYLNTFFRIESLETFLNIKQIVGITCVLILIYCFYLNLQDVLNNYKLIAPGRLIDGNTSFSNFISYGGFANASKVLKFLGGSPLTQDFDLFVGFIPIILSFYSLFLNQNDSVTRKIVIQLWLLILIFMILGHPFQQSYFHKLIYILPGINKVRHLAYFVTIIKPAFIILSAISLNNLINSRKKNFKFNLHIYLFFLLLVIFFYYRFYFELFLLILFFLIAYKKSINNYYLIIFCFSIIDIIHHQILEFPYYKYGYDKEKFISIANSEFPFQLRVDPMQSIKLKIFNESLNYEGFARYSSEVSYIREDFCYQPYRQDYLLKNLYQELNKNKLNFNSFVPEFKEKEEDKLLNRKRFGCNETKIKVLDKEFSQNTPIIEQSYADDDRKDSNRFYDNIEILDFKPNWLNFKINNRHKKTLPLLYFDTFHPYWEVYIDGNKDKIFEFNGAFKGLFVKPGVHIINFKIKKVYRILEMVKGLVLSGFIFLLFVYCVKRIKSS
jgi:hypothetical protein